MFWNRRYSKGLVAVAIVAVAIFVALALGRPVDHGRELRRAAIAGDLPIVRRILDAHPEAVNATSPVRPFADGVWGKAAFAFTFFVKGNLGLTDRFGMSALDLAVGYRHSEVAAELIRRGARTDRADQNGFPLIQAAIQSSDGILIAAFVDAKLGFELENAQGITALGWAIVKGNQEVAESLIEAGADINGGKMSPLMCAVKTQQENLVRFLIEKGSEVTRKSRLPSPQFRVPVKGSDTTPLQAAETLKNSNIVSILKAAATKNETK